jgi:omega-hydroxy-beta-dihydromenaquinone-9 sulfotransferase
MAQAARPKSNEYSLMMPRFWHGMPAHVWFPLLAKNGFRISPSRWPLAFGVSMFTSFTGVMSLTQSLFFGKSIRETKIVVPPIFVLGHWRSGTTLLHEYLSLDTRFATPTTFQCFSPWHFLLTEDLVSRFGGFLLPKHRPMDNMKAGWSLPQEDEFALMNMGAPTPYLRILFPNHAVPYADTLSSQEFLPEHLETWKKKLDWFLKAVTYKSGKRLLLKSPPHTGRLGILKSMYPDAKFIHIVRDPRKLYPSTVKLWNSLDEVQALQSTTDQTTLQAFVLQSLKSMYQSLERDRQGIPSDQFIDVNYESLVSDPIGVVGSIYDQLDLGSFDPVRKRLTERVQSERNYQTNKLELTPEEEAMVLREWREYALRYGYLS